MNSLQVAKCKSVAIVWDGGLQDFLPARNWSTTARLRGEQSRIPSASLGVTAEKEASLQAIERQSRELRFNTCVERWGPVNETSLVRWQNS